MFNFVKELFYSTMWSVGNWCLLRDEHNLNEALWTLPYILWIQNVSSTLRLWPTSFLGKKMQGALLPVFQYDSLSETAAWMRWKCPINSLFNSKMLRIEPFILQAICVGQVNFKRTYITRSWPKHTRKLRHNGRYHCIKIKLVRSIVWKKPDFWPRLYISSNIMRTETFWSV